MEKESPDRTRRHLLASAGLMAAAGLGRDAIAQAAPAVAPAERPLPPYVSWKNPAHVIHHTATTIETRRSAFGTCVITPADRLYIRNNLPAPDVAIVADRDAW